MSSAGMATDVRCGAVRSATSSGQMATTDMSSGTVRPAVRSTLSNGEMIASFCTTRPVVPGRSCRIRVIAPAAASWLASQGRCTSRRPRAAACSAAPRRVRSANPLRRWYTAGASPMNATSR